MHARAEEAEDGTVCDVGCTAHDHDAAVHGEVDARAGGLYTYGQKRQRQ
jgi:hypothetical protein